MKNKHIGSSLNDFLESEGIRSEVEEMALCKFLAITLAERLNTKGMSISEFAKKMGSSRDVARKVLNPANKNLTFRTASKAASALGMKFKVQLLEA